MVRLIYFSSLRMRFAPTYSHYCSLQPLICTVVQGGDLGCMVARFLCFAYPNAVKAHHVNNAVPTEPTEEAHPELCARVKATPLSGKELTGLARTGNFFKDGNGYLRQQATRPLTIGYSLQDSPTGLLAWIYEKLHSWSHNYAWTDDEILTWISIYYFSRAGPAASSYIYWSMENCDPPVFAAAAAWSDVPLGVSRFNEDTLLMPKLWNHTLGPIVFEAEHDNGGHFAAYERPDAIVQDLRSMFGKGGGAFGVVTGKDGY
jgi:pimeloyl-ACP methyl ester carboxylesterase